MNKNKTITIKQQSYLFNVSVKVNNDIILQFDTIDGKY